MSKKLIIRDKKAINKALHRKNTQTWIVCAVFLLVDVDVFMGFPGWIHFGEDSYKIILVIFQSIFFVSILFWERKKSDTLRILESGMITKGIFKDSFPVRNDGLVIHYVHEYEYTVGEKKFKIFSKAIGDSPINRPKIIYSETSPKKSVVYEHLDLKILEFITW